MKRPWWDDAPLLRVADRADEGWGEAGGPVGRTGALKVGSSSEASRLPQAEQNRPAAETSVPQFTQRTTIASVIGTREHSVYNASRFEPANAFRRNANSPPSD